VETVASTRQRRPAFDREKGVELARDLFHARGYDAVSVADLTEALDVKPPSLYAAYGSKLGLFERALRSYLETEYLSVQQILDDGADPASALTDLFVAAAKHYTRDGAPRGCLVTEAMRSDDDAAAALAATFAEGGVDVIRSYVAAHAAPEDADRILDYVLLTLRGLSSYACLGHSGEKLANCSIIAGRVLETEFARPAAGEPDAEH
jgi:TetR/AcrR family transcriptional repressor for divergent bdcA